MTMPNATTLSNAIIDGPASNTQPISHMAILVSYSGSGGVEHVINQLTREFVAKGINVDLLLIKARGKHLKNIPAGVNVKKLMVSSSVLSFLEVAFYLIKNKPQLLMAAKHRAIVSAVRAKQLSRVSVPIIGQLHTVFTHSLANSLTAKSHLMRNEAVATYPKLDQLIGVSQGVVDDITQVAGLDPSRVAAVCNPVLEKRFYQLKDEPIDHPWFSADADKPLILGAGRLVRAKDFPTLIRAFALVRKQLNCRLAILGEGSELGKLKALATSLDVAAEVEFLGFQPNPYKYMAKAKVFVLSSILEGSGNVLVEALAMGAKCVATDCPSGPAEILDHGRHGTLVPMNDHAAMADAIIEQLQCRRKPDIDPQVLNNFRTDTSANNYLALFRKVITRAQSATKP